MMLRPQPKQSSNTTEQPSTQSDTKRKPRYNRQKAVEYANKYAGAAWGPATSTAIIRNIGIIPAWAATAPTSLPSASAMRKKAAA